MSEPRCPHCQTVLPEKAAFCAACGNRIEGWTSIPAGAGERPTILPGGEEPTTNMQPTPSLLRAVAISIKKPDSFPDSAPDSSGDSAGDKKSRPMGILLLLVLVVGASAAGAAYYFASRNRAPTVVASSLGSPAPSPSLAATAALAATSGAAAGSGASLAHPAKVARSRHAHRIEPLEVAAKPPRRKSSGGGLPHKTVSTDSRPLPATATAPRVDPAASAAAILAPHEDAPVEATPQTDEEMKKEAEASIDADGIRFVVKSHLAQVHACYERAFKESSPGGRVEIGFAITPRGVATRVRTETNSTGSESLAACLESRVKSWQFPRPVGGDYELIYPFVFAAGS